MTPDTVVVVMVALHLGLLYIGTSQKQGYLSLLSIAPLFYIAVALGEWLIWWWMVITGLLIFWRGIAR